MPPQPSPASRFPRLPSGVLTLVVTASAVVTVFGIQQMAGILGPLVLALMLVIAVGPVRRGLISRGVPKWIAVPIVLILLYAGLLGLGALLAVSVARLATILPTYADQAQTLISTIEHRLEDLGVGSSQATAIISRIDPNQAINVITGLLTSLAGVLTNLLFLFILVFFLGIDSAGFPERLAAVSRSRPAVATALATFIRGTRRYLAVSTIFGLICAFLDGIALWWIGIPLPVLWALLAFITNYIPSIGFFVGLLPPALLGLLSGGVHRLLLVVIAYVVINFVIQTLIQPKFLGNSVGLTITMTFLGLTFWAWVLGALGALLAIPLTLLAKALLIDIDPNTRWLNNFIESKPDLDGSVQREVVEEFDLTEDGGSGPGPSDEPSSDEPSDRGAGVSAAEPEGRDAGEGARDGEPSGPGDEGRARGVRADRDPPDQPASG